MRDRGMTGAQGGEAANGRSKEIEMKKKQKTESKKLALRTETVRALDDLKLSEVAGGRVNLSSVNATVCTACI